MTEINSTLPIKTIGYGQPIKRVAQENTKISEVSALNSPDILSMAGISKAKIGLPLLQKNTDIIKTSEFKTVFPNFSVLDASKQEQVLKKVGLFEKKYPGFINKLAKINNPKYGNGFQFFFVPNKNDPKYKDSPGISVVEKAMGDSASGIVFGGTDGILENSVIKKPVARLSQAIVGSDFISSGLKSERIELDIGGMFTSSSEDTFAHEMGHVLHAYFLTNKERGELWSIFIKARDNDKFISDYSKTNHMEFFGEGIEEYLKQDSSGNFTGRTDFKSKNPEFYNFVARVVDSNVNRGTPQSTLESFSTIVGYGIKSAYNVSKNFLSEKLSSLTK